MRLVAGSEGLRDVRQAELDRHLEAMSIFIERLTREDRSPTCCTMILRSPASMPARALAAMTDGLADAGVRARAIFAMLDPQDDLKQIFSTLSALAPGEPGNALIRWAKDPRLLEAHEQVTYGTHMCWSGDAMRRDADKRNPLVLFDMDASDAAHLSELAFKALWAASVPVPERLLAAGGVPKPSGAYERQSGTPVAALRPHRNGWPLVRH